MGLTHYWNFNKVKNLTASECEEIHQKAIKECVKVLKAMRRQGYRLSGYSANSSKFYGGLKVNGAKGEDCEDFVIREHFNQNLTGDFCKTNGREYDDAVTACLSVLKYRLGDAITVSSDGDAEHWALGVEIARKVLRRQVPNPMAHSQDRAKAA